MRTRLDRHLAVAIAATTLLTACGSGTAPTRADGVEVATYEPTGEGGDAALLSGTVEDDGGCLKVRDSYGDVAYVPVFASNDRRARNLELGSTVELGGGEVSVTGDDFEGFPDSCPQDGPLWIVAQP